MFESEYAVEIQDGPAKISLFADKSLVQERGDVQFQEGFYRKEHKELKEKSL